MSQVESSRVSCVRSELNHKQAQLAGDGTYPWGKIRELNIQICLKSDGRKWSWALNGKNCPLLKKGLLMMLNTFRESNFQTGLKANG